jgi:hypothetical protein
MNLVAGLALILLTLVGYSSGSMLGAKGRTAVPGITDLLFIIVLWVGALATRNILGKWSAIGAWLAIGLILGAALAWMRAGSYPKAQWSNTGNGLWDVWKSFARKMGNYQSRVLMAFMYFTVALPFSLGVTIFGDPLRIKRACGNSNWQPKELPFKPSIDEARSQF